MKAKLFDAHNQLIAERDLPAADPTIEDENLTFRLIDTDEAGFLIYRRIDE